MSAILLELNSRPYLLSIRYFMKAKRNLEDTSSVLWWAKLTSYFISNDRDSFMNIPAFLVIKKRLRRFFITSLFEHLRDN